MAKVVWAEPALSDLDAIADYNVNVVFTAHAISSLRQILAYIADSAANAFAITRGLSAT